MNPHPQKTTITVQNPAPFFYELKILLNKFNAEINHKGQFYFSDDGSRKYYLPQSIVDEKGEYYLEIKASTIPYSFGV